MLTIPFLTDLDSRAAIKGTRDALGIQVLWTGLGRHVVGNLTTVSTSVRDFTTTLLGYHFAEYVAERYRGDELATFLKFEQLAGYVRAHVNKDRAIRGTERVQKRLGESSRVTLSAETQHQILSNQKTYGLLGLYTVPTRASGLLTDLPTRPSPAGRDVIDRIYLPVLNKALGRDARALVELLKAERAVVDLDGKHSSVARAIGDIMRSLNSAERPAYREHFVLGGPEDSTSGRQQQLAVLLDDFINDDSFTWSPGAVEALERAAGKRGWTELERRLRRIRAAEQVFAPTSYLFAFILGANGRSVDDTVRRIKEQWGASLRSVDTGEFAELRDEIGRDDPETGDRWISVAESLRAGDWDRVIRLLAELNAAVMKARGGDSWFVINGERLDIRYRDERAELPQRGDLPRLWRYPYFLESLRWVQRACGGSGVSS